MFVSFYARGITSSDSSTTSISSCIRTDIAIRNSASVAEARQNFARLIKRAEHGNVIEITRRGEPVVVLFSASDYAAMTGERSSFAEAVRRLQNRLGVEDLGIGDEDLDDLREESPGRDISL
jgi:prevent-host-death family protein